jgi:hypothetical protein
VSESNRAIEKLEAIQKLWAELGRVKLRSPEYDALLKRINVLSAEYQSLVNASNDREQSEIAE